MIQTRDGIAHNGPVPSGKDGISSRSSQMHRNQQHQHMFDPIIHFVSQEIVITHVGEQKGQDSLPRQTQVHLEREISSLTIVAFDAQSPTWNIAVRIRRFLEHKHRRDKAKVNAWQGWNMNGNRHESLLVYLLCTALVKTMRGHERTTY